MKRQFGIIILSLLTYLNVSGQITDFVKVTALSNSQIKHW
jgi:hypothetical protein